MSFRFILNIFRLFTNLNQINRKLAPFFKGLNDFKESWTDRQLLAAIRGLPIPSKDEVEETGNNTTLVTPTTLDPVQEHSPLQEPTTTSVASDETNASGTFSHSDESLSRTTDSTSVENETQQKQQQTHSIEIPTSLHHRDGIIDGINNLSSLNSNNPFLDSSLFQLPSTSAPTSSSFMMTIGDITSLTPKSQLSSSPSVPFPSVEGSTNSNSYTNVRTLDPAAVKPKRASSGSEISSPIDENSNKATSSTRSRANTTSRYGPAPNNPENKVLDEVLLYRGASECPICFLYYPKYLNITRCCVQPICTECFVQIKRSDPHPPYDDHDEDGANTPNSTTTPDSASVASNQTTEPLLVSEPAHCPYCMVTDFGVTFTPPPYRSGLESSGGFKKSLSQLGRLTASNNAKSAEDKTVVEDKSNPSFVSSTDAVTSPTTSTAGRRRGSIPPNAPEVVTIDRIRPDWSLKLASARAHAARRSAQATALHASAFLIDPQPRNVSGSSSRRSRGVLSGRRRGNSTESVTSGASGASGTPGPYTQAHEARVRARSLLEESNASSPNSGYVRGTREERDAREERIRVQQLEDIMMMEAIRLSLLDEENRKAKEDEEQRENDEDSENGDNESSSASANSNRNGESSGVSHQSPGSNLIDL